MISRPPGVHRPDSMYNGSRVAWRVRRFMRILYDHQVFSLQDAGGASRYHFELIRNLQGSDDIAIEVLIGLNGSVMPFATLQQATRCSAGAPA